VTGPAVPDGMDQPQPDSSGDRAITDLLIQLRGGRPDAMDRLFPLIYDQLRRMAHRQLQAEPPGHTLGTTGLVHETYIKLVDQTRVEWRDRGHFFRVSSMAMRRILVDYARRYRALRRGGGLARVPLERAEETALEQRSDWLLALEDALTRLAVTDERLSQIVECRYFGGLTEDETAEALDVSLRTVQRDWAKARGWLALDLRAEG
jgi:RNA polymerase sigma factor (TIGR02999 family)